MRLNVATLDPRYRRFRAELRVVTRITDESALQRWMSARSRELAAGYMATGEGGGPYDYMSWVCVQYVRAQGITP